MHYEIRHNKTRELTGFFENLTKAKLEAERLCNANNRMEHFSVVEMCDVWTTSTLAEVLKS